MRDWDIQGGQWLAIIDLQAQCDDSDPCARYEGQFICRCWSGHDLFDDWGGAVGEPPVPLATSLSRSYSKFTCIVHVCIVRNTQKSMKNCSCGTSSTVDALMYHPKVYFDSFHALHSSLFRYMPPKNKIAISTKTRERKTQLLLFRSLTPKSMLCRSSKLFQDARCSGHPILQPPGCFLQKARALDGIFLWRFSTINPEMQLNVAFVHFRSRLL